MPRVRIHCRGGTGAGKRPLQPGIKRESSRNQRGSCPTPASGLLGSVGFEPMQKCFRTVALSHRFADAEAHFFGQPLHSCCGILFFRGFLRVDHRLSNPPICRSSESARNTTFVYGKRLARNIESNQLRRSLGIPQRGDSESGFSVERQRFAGHVLGGTCRAAKSNRRTHSTTLRAGFRLRWVQRTRPTTLRMTEEGGISRRRFCSARLLRPLRRRLLPFPRPARRSGARGAGSRRSPQADGYRGSRATGAR
jgi:hypothetical protein